MRVLIINATERRGGPAIAAFRLTEALKASGIRAKMLVLEKETDCVTTVAIDKTWRVRRELRRERRIIGWHNKLKKQHRYRLDLGIAGCDITGLPEYRQADVVHLHWTCDGMISLDMIQHIVQSGKPVVWTMHDMWPFTGICHYAHDCENYMQQCSQCFQLNSSREHDLSYRYFERKRELLTKSSIRFIACSHWLEDMARKSTLLRGQHITCIPNAVSTKLFCPHDKKKVRATLQLPADRRLLLFTSEQLAERRKGLTYIVQATQELVKNHPEWADRMALVVTGKTEGATTLLADVPFPVYTLGYITDEHQMALIMSAVDIYTIPSLQDNLPNTVVEAMACGIPCIGFNVGGIPEMIDHLHNGYIAEPRDSNGLAEGIHWLLTEGDYDMLSRQALRKAQTTYSETSVAAAHIAIYNSITNKDE